MKALGLHNNCLSDATCYVRVVVLLEFMSLNNVFE